MMEWEKQEQQQQHEEQQNENGNGNGNGGGVIYVKVMTDEQMEILRKQIAVYAGICEQLVEMHKALTAQQDLAGMKFGLDLGIRGADFGSDAKQLVDCVMGNSPNLEEIAVTCEDIKSYMAEGSSFRLTAIPRDGVRLGNLYCDTLVTSNGHKITARQRWTPTPVQLQILERLFDQGNGTPSKQKIKEIATELSQHGQISETNVYNWFQNRRARSKRKQQVAGPNNTESEVETDVESPKEKKTKSENFHSQQIQAPRTEDLCFQSPEISSELHSLDPHSNKPETMFPSDGSLKPSRSLGQISFYDNMLSNPRIEHLMGKMEVPGSYNPYQHPEDYS